MLRLHKPLQFFIKINLIVTDNHAFASQKYSLYNALQIQLFLQNQALNYVYQNYLFFMSHPNNKVSQSYGAYNQSSIVSQNTPIPDNSKRKYIHLNPKHPSKLKFKTQACKYWLNDMDCPFQQHCNFAHGKVEQRAKNYLPTKYKTRLCQKFNQEGYCPYGIRCRFIHLSAIPKNFHMAALQCLIQDSRMFFSFLEEKEKVIGRPRRLCFFESMCGVMKDEGSTNAGTLSEEDRINEQQYLVLNTEGVRSRQGSY